MPQSCFTCLEQPERFWLVPLWSPAHAVYCGSMWVKKCSDLSISAVSEETTLHLAFLFSSPSTLLILPPLKSLICQCRFFLTFCCSRSAGAVPPALQKNPSIWGQEKIKMAVAGCPDYFLHHPNYQVSCFFFYLIFFLRTNCREIIDYGFPLTVFAQW